MQAHYLDEAAEAPGAQGLPRPGQTAASILIVTEKLLTGYDAPIAYCMYLDKPLIDHTLLQAIARVNRPYAGQAERRSSWTTSASSRTCSARSPSTSRATAPASSTWRCCKQRYHRPADVAAEMQLAPHRSGATVEGRTERIIEHFFDETLREPFSASLTAELDRRLAGALRPTPSWPTTSSATMPCWMWSLTVTRLLQPATDRRSSAPLPSSSDAPRELIEAERRILCGRRTAAALSHQPQRWPTRIKQ
jgi:hypothetical protein